MRPRTSSKNEGVTICRANGCGAGDTPNVCLCVRCNTCQAWRSQIQVQCTLMVTSDRGPSSVLPVSEEPRTELGEIQTEISSLAYLEA